MDIQKVSQRLRLRKRLPVIALHIIAVYVLWHTLTQTFTDDISLESGKWAIRWLLISLSISPLNTYFGMRFTIPLRKAAGLWAFGFAVVHVVHTLQNGGIGWLDLPLQPFIAIGLLGLTILTAMAITSNQSSMRRLGKHWKRLHRWVYLAGMAVIYHGILAAAASKKLLHRDPNAVEELNVYLAIMTVVLVVRIPTVKRLLLSSPVSFLRKRTALPPAKKHVTPIPKVNTVTYDLDESFYITHESLSEEEITEEDQMPVP